MHIDAFLSTSKNNMNNSSADGIPSIDSSVMHHLSSHIVPYTRALALSTAQLEPTIVARLPATHSGTSGRRRTDRATTFSPR